MDEIAHVLIQQEEEDVEGDLEQGLEQSAALAAVALMVIRAEVSCRLHAAECRQPSQLYLCRPQLLPNPCKETPWRVLYQSRSDHTFITTMGFYVDAFTYVVEWKTC